MVIFVDSSHTHTHISVRFITIAFEIDPGNRVLDLHNNRSILVSAQLVLMFSPEVFCSLLSCTKQFNSEDSFKLCLIARAHFDGSKSRSIFQVVSKWSYFLKELSVGRTHVSEEDVYHLRSVVYLLDLKCVY